MKVSGWREISAGDIEVISGDDCPMIVDGQWYAPQFGSDSLQMALDGGLKIDRAWAMPNRKTFSISHIAKLLEDEMGGGLWLDPFAGASRYPVDRSVVTNDFNPKYDTDYNLESLEFLAMFTTGVAAGVVLDPPYSVRQIKECYEGVGLEVTSNLTRSDWWTHRKREIARVVRIGGKVISFGWNSGGIGKGLGFEKRRILLVAHGGVHNDTICVVEVRVR